MRARDKILDCKPTIIVPDSGLKPLYQNTLGSRIVVTGMAGAGKSTLSKLLAAKTGLQLIHLDLHIWKPGWVRVSHEELLQTQHQLLAGSEWIMDGNDVDETLLLERADTLIIVATPWWICSWRAFLRGLRRPIGSQLPEGCEESFWQRIGDEWAIVFRNWRNRKVVPTRDMALAARCPASIQVHVLKSKQEIAYCLSQLNY